MNECNRTFNLAVLLHDIEHQIAHVVKFRQYRALRFKCRDNYSLKGYDENRCIFIHIPKTAGISVNQSLFGNLGGGHKTVKTYKRIFGPITYRKYFTFTFVRNPYSRILSAYTYLKKGGISNNDKKWANLNLSGISSFDDFVKTWLNEKSIWSYTHFKPQYYFLCDASCIPDVDFVGKFEKLNQDFKFVCNKIGLDKELSFYNKSSLNYDTWLNNYSDEALAKIYYLYAKDFNIFNYEPVIRQKTY